MLTFDSVALVAFWLWLLWWLFGFCGFGRVSHFGLLLLLPFASVAFASVDSVLLVLVLMLVVLVLLLVSSRRRRRRLSDEWRVWLSTVDADVV